MGSRGSKSTLPVLSFLGADGKAKEDMNLSVLAWINVWAVNILTRNIADHFSSENEMLTRVAMINVTCVSLTAQCAR